ncbi:hypothetical protein ACFW04_013989 [Cataglyphis niger]
MAQCGPKKTYEGISANYWFPSLKKNINNYLDNCLIYDQFWSSHLNAVQYVINNTYHFLIRVSKLLFGNQQIKNCNKEYDKRHKKLTLYNEDDYVLIKDLILKPSKDKKLKPVYKDLSVITKILNRYIIQNFPSFNIISRPYNSILSSNRIKYWTIIK